MVKKILKLIGIVLGVLIGLFVLSLIFYALRYSPAYVSRVLRGRTSDVYDYQVFPEKIIDPPPISFSFDENLQGKQITTFFETHPKVESLDDLLQDSGTQALIVIQDDTILYEYYGAGLARDSIVTSFSAAKSIDSVLIGFAIQEGYINSVNDPITDYIPELLERDLRFGDITIRDLLLMSSGIKYQEFPFINGDDAKTYYRRGKAYKNMKQLEKAKADLTKAKALDPSLTNNIDNLLKEIETGQPDRGKEKKK